ncbi:MAG TPA: hypothetical protein VK806_03095 [Bacteroidia bacterium]|nr:hypothetical protein [Bacteroidia bacterium]
MNELEKFDDLLRSKLSERDLPFDEHNWDKLDRKIELAEKRRKSKRFAIIFASGMALGVLIMIPFILNKNSVTQQATQPIAFTNTVNNQTAPVQSNNTSANTTTNTPISNSSHPTSSGSNNGVSQPVASINDNKANGNNLATGNDINSQINPVVASSTKKQKTSKSSLDKANNPDQYSYVRHKKEKHSHKSADNTVVNTQNTNPSTINPAVASNNDVLKTTQGQNTNNETVNNNTSTTGASNPNTDQTNNITQNTNSVTTNETPSNTVASTPKTSGSDSAASKDNSTLVNKDKTSSPDSADDNFSNMVPPKKVSSSLTTVSIDGGAGYSLGWMKEGATQGSGISPIFGMSTTHYFNAKLSAYLGVQFNMLTNINTLYSSSIDQYGFGLNSNVNSVTLKTFYYAAVPIRLQYCFGFNNMIGIGANVLYLFNTSSSVVTYNQDYFGTSGYTSANKSGYMDGISTIDLQAVITYKRKIYNRFSAGVEFYYGLLNIEDESFFNDNTFARNSGLKLIFSYDIIK